MNANKDEEFISVIPAVPSKDNMNEVERLREENKRLKRTLIERFDETFY